MDAPIIDPSNPCYCPALPAATFLQDLRRALLPGSTSYGPNSFFSAFARILDPTGPLDDDSLIQHFQYDSENDWIVGVNVGARKRGRGAGRAASKITAKWPTKGPIQNALGDTLSNSPSADIDDLTLSGYTPQFQSTALPQQRASKRKRDPSPVPPSSDSSSSDMGEPAPKYGKSELVADESSFELEVRREPVDFDVTGSPTLLSTGLEEKEEAPICDPDALLAMVIGRVIALLPGMRLEERLAKLPDLSIQKVADFLAENGYMNHTVLNTFQRTGVTRLCLSTSLWDEDGLNICGEEVIKCRPTTMTAYF